MVTPKNIWAGNTEWTKQDTFLYSFIRIYNYDLKRGDKELEDRHGRGMREEMEINGAIIF